MATVDQIDQAYWVLGSKRIPARAFSRLAYICGQTLCGLTCEKWKRGECEHVSWLAERGWIVAYGVGYRASDSGFEFWREAYLVG